MKSQILFRALLPAALAAAVAPAAALAAPAATTPPSVKGALAFGQTVGCEPGTWSGDPVSFRYDWIVNGSSRGGGQTFAIDDPYYRSYPLACQVTATDASGATGVASSPAAQPAAGRSKLLVTRFVAQRRGRILVTGKVTPAAIGSRWGGGSVILRRRAPGRRDGGFFQLSESSASVRRDGSFRVVGIDAPGRWAIRLDFNARANTLWDPASVTRTLRISSGGRGCGGCTALR